MFLCFFTLGFTDGVSKNDNSRQGRIPLTIIFQMNGGRVSYTLAPIDYQDLNNTKLVHSGQKI